MNGWNKIKSCSFVLASRSPRRHYLLKELGLNFVPGDIDDIDEVYPDHLKAAEIAEYLARLKADAHGNPLTGKTIVITADTIVWHRGEVINKPANEEEAIQMLKRLSNDMHQVFTGVCIMDESRCKVFSAETKVYFHKLSEQDIRHYVTTFKPLDKAGAYGIQEWIGYIGVKRLEGCYWNVMGLPVQRLYQELIAFGSILIND